MSTPVARMRRCPECNVDNAGSSDRCIVCGADLTRVVPVEPISSPTVATPTAMSPEPAPHRRRRRALRIIAFLVLLAGIALAVVLSARDDDNGLPAPPSTRDRVASATPAESDPSSFAGQSEPT